MNEITVSQVQDLEDTLRKLTSDYKRAIDEKVRCQKEADDTTKTIQLANSNENNFLNQNDSGKK